MGGMGEKYFSIKSVRIILTHQQRYLSKKVPAGCGKQVRALRTTALFSGMKRSDASERGPGTDT